jgi:3-phenylpropionate/trans-cinnamate dioxygenase ferredoxin subunit
MSKDDEPTEMSRLVPTGYGSEDPAIAYAFRFLDASQPPKARTGKRLTVCHKDELPPGERRIVDDGRQGIGVFNINGQYHAVKNVCPHAGAELCRGSIHATHRPSDVGEFDPAYHGRILRCPWHGWEFDIVTGKGLYDRNSRVATYPVEIDEAGNVVVVL